MKLRIYRDGDPMGSDFLDVEVFNCNVKRTLMGNDEVTFNVEAESAIDIPIGAVLAIDNGPYTMNALPVYEKVSDTLHSYSFVFQAPIFDMDKVAFLDVDGNTDFYYDGTVTQHVALIVANMQRAYTSGIVKVNWIAGTSDTSVMKTIQFSKVTCWAALNLIADEFDMEFTSGKSFLDQVITLKKTIGNTKAVSLAYKSGLFNIKRQNVNNDKLVTRLYYRGSDRNLPSGYGYPRLKGTTEYIQDAAKVALYGIHEGFVDFDEICPSYTGTVTTYSVGAGSDIIGTEFRVFDTNLPFDLNETDEYGTVYLVDGTTPKINFKTGQCAGHTFDIQRFKSTQKCFVIIPYESQSGAIKVPNATIKPAIGDEYTLTDINLPLSSPLIPLSVAALDAAAEDHYEKVSTPRVAYTMQSAIKHFATNNIKLNLGDKITITDTDIAIEDECRVVELSYPYFDPANVEFKLTDVRFFVPGRKDKMDKRRSAIINDSNKLINAEKIVRSQKTVTELQSKLLDADQLLIGERVRKQSLDPNMQALDSGEIQFSLKSAKIETNAGGDANALAVGSGEIIHHSFNALPRPAIEELLENNLPYEPARTWTINSGTLTLATANAHFIYAKLPLATDQSTATIFADENHIWAKRDEGYIIYKLGSVGAVVDGKRDLSVLWGGGGHLPVSIALNAAEILSVNDNQVLDIDLSAYAKITDLHNALIVNIESEPYLTVTEDQVISLNLSAFNLHPAVSLGTGSETELALNPTTQVLTLTGLKKTFLSLNDTFDAYPAGGLGYMLISGDSSVLYSQAFGSDSEGAWAQITPEIENVGSNILSNTYFSPSTGWTIGSPWVIQSFGNPPPYDYAAYFSATGSGIISQQITLETGKTYRVKLFASDYETTPLVEVLIDGSVVAIATEGDSSRYSADFESPTTGEVTLGIRVTSPGTLAVFNVTVSEVTITAGRGLRMCNSVHATKYILPTSAPSENDVVFARADGQLVFGQINDFLPDTFLLDTDFPTAGLMLTDGAGNYSVITDNSAIWNTALVDADFASNGLMVRTGAGTYSTVADNSATWNTLASLGTKTFWNGTQAAYDAIGTKDSNTIYFINV